MDKQTTYTNTNTGIIDLALIFVKLDRTNRVTKKYILSFSNS